jgi:hypothetical protein
MVFIKSQAVLVVMEKTLTAYYSIVDKMPHVSVH